MTDATARWLIRAAQEARDYIARKNRGESDKGQYEGLEIARTLTAVLDKVHTEQERGIAAALSEAR